MIKPMRSLGIALCCSLLMSSQAAAQLQQIKTDNMTLIYLGAPHEFIVPHLARCFENALSYHKEMFDYAPSERVTVFLQDFSDHHNAGAASVPRNFVRMHLAPSDYTFETTPGNERINWTMNHEIVHLVTTEQAAGPDKFFRKLFSGKVQASEQHPISILYSFLTNPRNLSPRWYHEGLAVFWETWMAGGRGRAMGSYDEMVFRSMVRDSSYIYDLVGLESEGTAIDFQVGANSYLYGTRFVSYLALTYGPEKVRDWASRRPGSKAYFASQFKQIFGLDIDVAWSKWIIWENDWQQKNLASIRKNPVTNFRPVVQKPLGSISRMHHDTRRNRIYAALLYPGQVAHIAEINPENGRLRKLYDVKGPALYTATSLAYNAGGQKLYFTTDNNRWRDLNELDIRTGNTRPLMRDARVGDLVYSDVDSTIWGVRHHNGFSTLVRIPHPFTEWRQVYSFEYGNDISEIDISADGKRISAALVEISGRQKLIMMQTDSLLAGRQSYQELFDFENNLPANFVFTRDGRYLFGSSYYTGVSNIFRFEFETAEMRAITNAESGFFRPLPVSKDSLLAVRYSGEGFQPVKIAASPIEDVSATRYLGNEIVKNHPIVKAWILGSPARVDLDSALSQSFPYRSMQNLRPVSVYPVLEGYKDAVAVGMHFSMMDLLGLTQTGMTASWSKSDALADDERLHIDLSFRHWNLELHASYNNADFYDLFGPTKTSRKGYAAGISYNKNLIYDQPRTLDLEVGISGYGGLERLPDFQNVAATFEELVAARARLDYRHLRKSLGAVDDEKGVQLQLVSEANHVNGETYPRLYATLDYGVQLPLGHSSIWLRSAGGHAFGDVDNPFANFFFGGFGNNWVDFKSEKRYRKYYSFPGAELNAFGGRNFARTTFELNLPPLRFRRFGWPSLYARWARPAFFASAIRTNLDQTQNDSPRAQFGSQRTLTNFGAQVDFNLVLFSRLNATLSAGYARAFEQNQRATDEFLLSLKIL